MNTNTQEIEYKTRFKNNFLMTDQKKSISVYNTYDHDKFKILKGNRSVKKSHVENLKKSLSEDYLFTLILVNEKLEVIDGQHRLQALKELNLPVNYIIIKGYGVEEVKRLNINNIDWTKDNYLNHYCDLGFKNYILYRDFKKTYGFHHNECQTLLTGSYTRGKKSGFEDGVLEIPNLKDSINKAELILRLAPYYKGYKRRSFIYTILTLLKKPQFDFNEFIKKLEIQPTKLVDCTNQEQYAILIEEIYNYRRRDKINLRY